MRVENHLDLRERLKNLEDLVSSVAQQELRTPSTTSLDFNSFLSPDETKKYSPSPLGPSREDNHLLRPGSFRGTQMRYTESNHWSSVLESIRSIRADISPANAQSNTSPSIGIEGISEDECSVSDLDLTFVSAQTPTLEDILLNLPSRRICDNLVSRYFRSKQIVLRRSHSLQMGAIID